MKKTVTKNYSDDAVKVLHELSNWYKKIREFYHFLGLVVISMKNGILSIEKAVPSKLVVIWINSKNKMLFSFDASITLRCWEVTSCSFLTLLYWYWKSFIINCKSVTWTIIAFSVVTHLWSGKEEFKFILASLHVATKIIVILKQLKHLLD